MKKVVPKRGMPLLARTFEKFKLEVTALLVIGHGWKPKQAHEAVKRWQRYVRKRWSQGKPPCAVADHIQKWQKEKVVCPCKGKGRDCAKCRRRKGRGGRSLRVSSSSRSSRRKTSRDADDPKEGEILESKRGNRWRVVRVDGERVLVESAGRKTPGRLAWSKANLRGMRTIEKGSSSRQLSLFGSDPSRRRRRRKRRG